MAHVEICSTAPGERFVLAITCLNGSFEFTGTVGSWNGLCSWVILLKKLVEF